MKSLRESILDKSAKPDLKTAIQAICEKYWKDPNILVEYNLQENSLHISIKNFSIQKIICKNTAKFLKESGIQHLVFHDIYYSLLNCLELKDLKITSIFQKRKFDSFYNYIQAHSLNNIQIYSSYPGGHLYIESNTKPLSLKQVHIEKLTTLTLMANQINWDSTCQAEIYSLRYVTGSDSDYSFKDLDFEEKIRDRHHGAGVEFIEAISHINKTLKFPKGLKVNSFILDYPTENRAIIFTTHLPSMTRVCHWYPYTSCYTFSLNGLSNPKADWYVVELMDSQKSWAREFYFFT